MQRLIRFQTMLESGGISLPKDMQELQSLLSAIMYTLNSKSKLADIRSTPMGQYLDGHPFFALALLVFGAMATVPLGLFLTFAIVTFVTASVGFVFLQGFLLSLGGIALLCVLCGLAIIAFAVSVILRAFYITSSNVLDYYYSRRSAHMKQDTIGSCPGCESDASSCPNPSFQKQKGQ
ncbi:lipid droplet assembly factor 1-like isoform X1 [Acipenser oxyrinchus oxyrinchus]|uniref:Lipid droplet assembly factor 1-like isoform X1 n=1 Tax=Acipenser oxyrinchus oxyrinchus TaxID=40147 RepID=A0AAD8G5Q1_ACIOX|nr:lipid droplet assembly factor 1-like isoform X1 [Acipenser oxyrinchus oxyrinchus]